MGRIMPKLECHIIKLGTLEYLRAWDLQRFLVQEVADGDRPNALLLLEHPHVYTMGRRGSRDHVLLDGRRLAELGVPLHEADRGGEVTYHGPGQLVAYPILDLRGWGGPVKYVRTLERVMVGTLADLGVAAHTIDGVTGVWVGDEKTSLEQSWKIGAIGVKISRGVCYHGFAMNVNTDLSYFGHILPCGFDNGKVTSVEALLGAEVDMELVAYSLVYHFGEEMGFRMVDADLPLDDAAGDDMAGDDTAGPFFRSLEGQVAGT